MRGVARVGILFGLGLAIAVLGCAFVLEPARGGPARPATAASPSPLRAARPTLRFDAAVLPGTYYLGDGLGVNCQLVLQPGGRFTFKWHGCMGEYDRNQGRWALIGDVVALSPERPHEQHGFRGLNVRFIPVQWRRRLLLVDEHEMPGFCAAARRGRPGTDRYVHGFDFVKTDPVPAAGPGRDPVIPDRFQEFYERGPFWTRVVAVGRDGQVVLGRGSTHRLRPGMLLGALAAEPVNLEVVSVTGGRAAAKVYYFWNSDRQVRAGDLFSTGGEWSRPRGTGYRRLNALPG